MTVWYMSFNASQPACLCIMLYTPLHTLVYATKNSWAQAILTIKSKIAQSIFEWCGVAWHGMMCPASYVLINLCNTCATTSVVLVYAIYGMLDVGLVPMASTNQTVKRDTLRIPSHPIPHQNTSIYIGSKLKVLENVVLTIYIIQTF